MSRLLFFVLGILAASPTLQAQAESADQLQADSLMHGLIDAEAAKDYDAFIKNGTTEVKAALTKTQFEASSDLLNARTKGGYDMNALGELNQRGYQVYLYRLHFKDGGDDILATLSVKNGQFGGIYFH